MLLAKAAALERRLESLQRLLTASSDAVAAQARKARQVVESPKAKPEASRVIYIGHVPHGFYEDQMRGFFGQFGEVTNVRLSRSKATGGSKGYAFVEFGDPDVARIAAVAMDAYLMGDKRLVCHVAPLDFVKSRPRLFVGKKRKTVRGSKTRLDARIASPKGLQRAQRRKRAELERLGIHYDLPLPRKKKQRRDEAATLVAKLPKKKKEKKSKNQRAG